MSKPLIADPKQFRDANAYHRAVFAEYGSLCWFGARVWHPKKRANDAAHILKKSHLGPLRFADVRFARPLCRECHLRQEANDPKFQFAYADYKIAVLAHNEIAIVKINLVDRATYTGKAA